MNVTPVITNKKTNALIVWDDNEIPSSRVRQPLRNILRQQLGELR